MIKSIIYATVVVSLFFASLEVAQRVRYYVRYGSSYWLLFGFVPKPVNYDEVHMGKRQKEPGVVKKVGLHTIDYGGYRKYNPEFSTKNVKINSFGLRGKEFDIKKGAGVYRIVALGASTTFGLYVNDGYTYPDFLENILNQRSDVKYNVINAGISGSQLDECTALFKKEILPLKPDMIIISSVFNNLYYSNNAHTFSNSFTHRINWFLLDHSLLYLTFREKMKYALHRPVQDIYKANLFDILNNFLKDDEFWVGLESKYLNILELAEKNKIRTIIIKQPVWLRDHKKYGYRILLDEECLPVYERTYALLDKVAREKSAPVIQASSGFNKLRNKDEYFIDGLHLTEKGNSHLANLVARAIIRVD